MRFIDKIAGHYDEVGISIRDLFQERRLPDAENLVVQIRDLDDREVAAKPQIDVIFAHGQVVVLVKAEAADDDLEHSKDRNHEELSFQRFVVEDLHAEECADRAADPRPEEKCLLGDAAGACFRVSLVHTVEDERDEINQDEVVNEYHVMSVFRRRDDAVCFAEIVDEVRIRIAAYASYHQHGAALKINAPIKRFVF